MSVSCRRPPRAHLVALALLMAAGVASAASNPPRKVILLSWDAGADWVVDRLLDEGRLPNVARMAREGVRADYMTAAFPSKTAVGHAALFTGCWGDVNGITGNLTPIVPRSEHTIFEYRSGFSSQALTAEPIWLTAAKAGRMVAALSATHLSPPEPLLAELDAAGVPRGRLAAFDGFGSMIAGPQVHDASSLRRPAIRWGRMPRHAGAPVELVTTAGGSEFFALAYDDPSDPVKGLDTLMVRQGSRDADEAHTAVLKPRPASESLEGWSKPFDVALDGSVGIGYFRLFDLAPDGSRMTLYQRSVHALESTVSREETLAFLHGSGGFTDEAFEVYATGGFGPPLFDGGQGEAERRILELVRLDAELAKRGVRWALDHWHPDLLLHYTPMTDSAGHVWVGALDPTNPTHDPAVAARIWPYYASVFELADSWLGSVLEAAGREYVVALVSDHGVAGVSKYFHPNAVLAEAGLLPARGGERAVPAVRVVAPPTGDFYVSVNGTDRLGGSVAPAEREAMLRAATAALLAVRDHETGAPIVTAVLRADDMPGSGIGGPLGGDLYIELAPGYYPSSRPSDVATERFPNPTGHGEHGFLPLRRTMQAIFYASGPGVAAGKTIPAIRQIDVFPTLAALMGIRPPATVRGHAVCEVLAE